MTDPNLDIRRLTKTSEAYPARLLDLHDAPAAVWARGALPAGRAVGVVGTRRASPEALAFTERLARTLGRAGVAIISGGAEGVDAAAHRGALEGGGPTLVVHGTSLEALYPKRHARLFAAILEAGGGWLTETPAGAPSEGWRFLRRNRLIAALADLLVVVQAPARSGALATARAARALGRPLLAVPASPWDPRGAGTLGLLRGGARLCLHPDDALALLGLPGVPLDPPAPPPVSAEAARLLEALRDGPAHPDALVARTALSAAQVQVALIELSVQGRARQAGGLWSAV